MKTYSHILLALELIPESDQKIIEKTKTLAAQFQAKITLIHSIEELANFGAAYSMAGGVDVETELLKESKELLKKIGKNLSVAESDQIVKMGPAKHNIIDSAKEVHADLIIMGSHGRHGVRILLGSTTNAVLHSAECDVLAVFMKT